MFEEHIGRLALLHAARRRCVENDAQWKAIQAEHTEFLEGKSLAEEAMATVAAVVREEAVVLYKTVPNIEKTSIPGVTIRETKVVGFDPEKALAWAMEHKIALKLDEALYKKLVLAEQAPGSVTVALTAAIAQDLSEFAL